jgi:hypothetical protein
MSNVELYERLGDILFILTESKHKEILDHYIEAFEMIDALIIEKRYKVITQVYFDYHLDIYEICKLLHPEDNRSCLCEGYKILFENLNKILYPPAKGSSNRQSGSLSKIPAKKILK